MLFPADNFHIVPNTLILPRRSRWRQKKAETWPTGSVLLATWSALPRPRTACGKCSRWPLERRCRSASARREAAARCCEQLRRHKIHWPIGEKQNTQKRTDLLPNGIFVLYLAFHDNRQTDQSNTNKPNTGNGLCLYYSSVKKLMFKVHCWFAFFPTESLFTQNVFLFVFLYICNVMRQ